MREAETQRDVGQHCALRQVAAQRGDMLGHLPLPAKITVEALPPIYLREEFGAEPDLDEVYDHVIRLMQETLDALAAERRLPVIG